VTHIASNDPEQHPGGNIQSKAIFHVHPSLNGAMQSQGDCNALEEVWSDVGHTSRQNQNGW
jgi:hypothetical protein